MVAEDWSVMEDTVGAVLVCLFPNKGAFRVIEIKRSRITIHVQTGPEKQGWRLVPIRNGQKGMCLSRQTLRPFRRVP